MRNFILKNIGTLLIAFAILGGATTTISAQRAERGNRVSDKQIETTLSRIENRTNTFSRSFQRAIDRSSLNGSRNEEQAIENVRDFENATNNLKNRFENENETLSEVQDVLNQASYIDQFLRRNNLNSATKRDWNFIKTELNALARYYNISWNWNSISNNNNNSIYEINGTYRLNVSQSSNVESEINQAIRNANVSFERQQKIRENAFRRLESPQMLAFERMNSTVTIASSNSPKLTIEADGRDNSEQMDNGRTMKTRARFSGEQLMIDFTGDKMNDYSLTFEPIKNTNRLRVTRRLYLEGINREVSVFSVYDRSSIVAEWNNVYQNGNTNSGNNNNINNNFYIPNGTNLNATLNNEISTKRSSEGDRFTMTVNSPSQYSGAIIEGRVTKLERSGKISGRAEMTLEFDQIRLRNGQTYRFAGFIQSAKSSNGDNVRISNEGEIKSDDNQTTKTVTRTGIGAVLGALIGAIANGGQGAAIGAGIGAGAGAGSVLIQGREDLQLNSGTEVTISSSAPRQVARN